MSHETQRKGHKRFKPPEVVDLTQDHDETNIVITIDDSIPIICEIPSPPRRPRLKSRPQPSTPPPASPPNALKCPICIETFANVKTRGLKVVVTRCGHIFCDFCLKKALADNGRKCPKCRKTLPKSSTSIIEVFDVC